MALSDEKRKRTLEWEREPGKTVGRQLLTGEKRKNLTVIEDRTIETGNRSTTMPINETR
ncbi:hypothetical protein FHS27_002911 [Rhodopirellula rubra]|uniref:Uncharacterized protein n=1 Tax=Aporhodopirellula rubra TaxID=980271 RepID=A0A7W5E0N4_9BACT|nr:hypothetical protein [Aporhodopirellula rubra]